MPCNSDYLEQSSREWALQRAAKLLVYLKGKLEQPIEPWMAEQAEKYYADDDRSVTVLCATLKSMQADQIEEIVYNAHDSTARDLADWWEEHQAADAERERKEAEEAEQKRLQAEALAKLTPAEIAALKIRIG